MKTISKTISNRLKAGYFGLELCKLYILPQTTNEYSLPFFSNFDTTDLNFTEQHFNPKLLCLKKSITFYIYFELFTLEFRSDVSKSFEMFP